MTVSFTFSDEGLNSFLVTVFLPCYQIAISVCKSVTNNTCGHLINAVHTSVNFMSKNLMAHHYKPIRYCHMSHKSHMTHWYYIKIKKPKKKKKKKSRGGWSTRIFMIISRVMIHYHLNIQLFTTLFMWQGGPSP
jgi:hypothetical protein